MPLFDIVEDVNIYRERAKNILLMGNQVAEEILRLHGLLYDQMWNVEGFTIVDAQKVIDEMILLHPMAAAAAFQFHAAIGQLIEGVQPGLLSEERKKAPVGYTVEGARIVLDPNAKYPTEKEVVVEEQPL